MQQILFRLPKDPRFDILKINLEHLIYENDPGLILDNIIPNLTFDEVRGMFQSG